MFSLILAIIISSAAESKSTPDISFGFGIGGAGSIQQHNYEYENPSYGCETHYNGYGAPGYRVCPHRNFGNYYGHRQFPEDIYFSRQLSPLNPPYYRGSVSSSNRQVYSPSILSYNKIISPNTVFYERYQTLTNANYPYFSEMGYYTPYYQTVSYRMYNDSQGVSNGTMGSESDVQTISNNNNTLNESLSISEKKSAQTIEEQKNSKPKQEFKMTILGYAPGSSFKNTGYNTKSFSRDMLLGIPFSNQLLRNTNYQGSSSSPILISPYRLESNLLTQGIPPIVSPHSLNPLFPQKFSKPINSPYPLRPIIDSSHSLFPNVSPYSSRPIVSPYSSRPIVSPFSSHPAISPNPLRPIVSPHPTRPLLNPHRTQLPTFPPHFSSRSPTLTTHRSNPSLGNIQTFDILQSTSNPNQYSDLTSPRKEDGYYLIDVQPVGESRSVSSDYSDSRQLNNPILSSVLMTPLLPTRLNTGTYTKTGIIDDGKKFDKFEHQNYDTGFETYLPHGRVYSNLHTDRGVEIKKYDKQVDHHFNTGTDWKKIFSSPG